MSMENNAITWVGHLTADPVLRFTGNGQPVANLRVISNRKFTDRNGNVKEEATGMNIVAWRGLAENATECLSKGDRVVVLGRIVVSSYEQNGQTHWKAEIQADEISPSLRWAKVDGITKTG